MWHQGTSYIKFLIRSTNQHGVHSPFVYNLVTKCFYDKADYEAYKLINKYRTDLLKKRQTLEITDLGAGSKRMSNTRKIATIIKQNSTTLRRAKLLFRLVKYFKSQNILELGTSLGIAANAMHLGNPNSNITTIEGCSNIANQAKSCFKTFKCENVTLLNGEFTEVLQSSEVRNQKSFALIFIDGNHQKEATLSYFETLLSHIHNNSIMIFDDIYWSKGMTEAWQAIKEHPKVTVTIDTFNWGLVFFRKEQEKENFTIRL